MAEELQPIEIIGLVDSILNSKEAENETEITEADDHNEINSERFFSIEEFDWLSSFLSILETRTNQSAIANSLADIRQQLLNSEHNAKDFFTKVANCRKCSNAKSPPVVFEGNRAESRVSFVLPHYAPDASEKVQLLAKEHFDSKDISLHYMVKCVLYPYKPGQDNINNCSPYLLSELQFFRAQVIVLMGKQVTQYFFPNIDSLEKWRGKVHYLGSYPFIITFHPSDRILDNEYGMDQINADLNLIKTLL